MHFNNKTPVQNYHEEQEKQHQDQKMYIPYVKNLEYAYIRTFSGRFRGHETRLINKNGQLHETAKEIIRVSKGIRLARMLKAFLLLEGSFCSERCVPSYRDAIAFYSQEQKVVGIIHLCLECGYLEYEAKRVRLTVDSRAMLQDLLFFLGHGSERRF